MPQPNDIDIRLVPGQQAKYSLSSNPPPGCRVVIMLQPEGSSDWSVMSGADENGNPVPSLSDVGNFHKVQHSFGQITLRARDVAAVGKLRMRIVCENPAAIGAGVYSIGTDRVWIGESGGSGFAKRWWKIFLLPFALILLPLDALWKAIKKVFNALSGNK